MDNRLKDRVAVITGGSSGIGRATALLFANVGAKVIIADLRSQGVEGEVTAQHGQGRAKFVACDVADEQQVISLVQKTVEWAGRLDIFCNVAGLVVETKYGMQARCHEFDVKDFDQAMAVNARGTWLCSKYALAQMLAQEPRQPNARGERTRGWIVNVGSIGSVNGRPKTPAYIPAKHAVVGMTKQMALDYAEDRIHVNAVCPGFVKTPMAEVLLKKEGVEQALAKSHPWNALGTAEDCANAALFLATDDSAWISGHTLMVDGAYSAQ